MCVDYLISIDPSEYRPINSSTKHHLREMRKTPFEHFCSVLDSTDEVDDFKTLSNTWKLHNSKKRTFLLY